MEKKIKIDRRKKIKIMNYDIFCYLNKKKQIALTKENKISFLKNFNLPLIKKMELKSYIKRLVCQLNFFMEVMIGQKNLINWKHKIC